MTHVCQGKDVWRRTKKTRRFVGVTLRFHRTNTSFLSSHISWLLHDFLRRCFVMPPSPPEESSAHHIKSGNVSASIVITTPLEAKLLDLCWILACLLFFFPLFTHLFEQRGQTHAELSALALSPFCWAFLASEIWEIIIAFREAKQTIIWFDRGLWKGGGGGISIRLFVNCDFFFSMYSTCCTTVKIHAADLAEPCRCLQISGSAIWRHCESSSRPKRWLLTVQDRKGLIAGEKLPSTGMK